MAFSFHLLICLYLYASVMLYYSSTVGVAVKIQPLVIRSILEKEIHKSSQCSAELTVYNPSYTVVQPVVTSNTPLTSLGELKMC